MLFEPLFAHAARQGGELAVIDDRGRYTYQQLAEMAAALAGRLKELGQPRIGLLLPSGADFVAGFYACLLAGSTVVPINFLLDDAAIAHCVRDSGIQTVLTIPQLAGRVNQTALKVIDLTQLPQSPPPAMPPRFPSPGADDPAVLMYTSGTSGLPKGVLLSYGNLQSDVDAAIAYVNFQSRHKFLGIVPLFHAMGMTAMMLAPIQLGASIVYIGRFSPVATVNAIKEHAISLVIGVPSMFAALLHLKNATAEDFKSIYAIISGGEPLPSSLREAFHARFGVMLLEAYGMTETSLAISLNTPQIQKAGSVGKPIPGMEVKIVDDSGAAVASGEPGEIWLKGPMVTRGYHNLPQETAAQFTSDGYFKTGDLGLIDADGFLHITGRKKDLIIIAGEKVSPREIEEMLMLHPAVQEAAVIGKKDPSRGEVVLALVIARQGQSPEPQELREFCRQRGLAQWKIPREIRMVQDLPRSPTGKVLKRLLS